MKGASGDNSQMTLEEIRAVVATAHDYGFAVAAHAHGAEAIRRAVIGGVDSIEHGTFMDAEDMKLMVEHGTYYVPTIIAGDFVARQAKIPGLLPGDRSPRKAAAIGPLIQATAGRAYKAHVKIAFGTDAAVYPHGQNAHEFELMVGAGMPPMFVHPGGDRECGAVAQARKDLGSVTAGKIADVVAVPGNPHRRHQPHEARELRDEGWRRLQIEFRAGGYGAVGPANKEQAWTCNLTKKIALVSGSTAGIGNAIATSLAREGATVIVNGRTPAAVEAAVAAMKSATGGEVLGFAGDLSVRIGGRKIGAAASARRHPGE